MSPKQQRRVDILTRLSADRITREQAAELLGVSYRHVGRLLADFESDGIASVLHGNAGRTPTNKTDAGVSESVLSMSREGGKYHGFNTCHLTDLLRDEESIVIGRSTLDRVLRENHLIRSGRRRTEKRKRRERSSAEGSMLQIDGSPHDWLEGRAERMCLVGAVDDATGRIVYAQFRPTEDLIGYLLMLRTIVETHGLPVSLYHDKHTILRSPKEATIEDELAGREPQSQFQRVMDELGIESITAHSPQAKGRVERAWGVLQDRLVKEMRLSGIGSLDDANQFLPGFIARYNARFAVEPADKQSAWMQIGRGTDMAYYFCIREARTVRSDYTIAWMGSTLQILPSHRDRSLVGKRVNVHAVPEGDLYVYEGRRRLEYRMLKARPQKAASPDPKPIAAPSTERAARRRGWLHADERRIA